MFSLMPYGQEWRFVQSQTDALPVAAEAFALFGAEAT